MSKQVVEYEKKFSYELLRFLLYASLLMPLLFWNIFLFPFITTKILYFRLVVELALALYVILALRYPELRPRSHPLMIAVWVYLAVVSVVSIFGLNFYRSFWGTVERGEGLISILHFVIYFTLLPQVFRTRKDWYNYLFFAVVLTAINALYGLGQVLNLSFLTNTTGSRVAGTIGNPSFFAAYLLFGVFLSLYLLSETPKGRRRIFLWIVFWFDLYILYQTATRGALIALTVAFVLYLLFSVFKSQKAKFKVTSLVVLLMLIGFGFLVYKNRSSQWVNKTAGLRRLASISLNDITTQSRLDTWQASWKSWKDRFFTGYGYENYNLAFNKNFPPRIFKDSGSQIWFDRAHNLIFDIGVTSGIVGLAAYMGMILTAFYCLFKLYRKFSAEPDVQKYLFLGLGLTAYLISNLSVFDTQATYLMFFLTLGFIAALYQMEFTAPIDLKRAKIYRSGIWLKGLAVVLFFIVANWFNIQPARANYHTTKAITATRAGQYEEVKPSFEKALSYGTYMDEEIRQKLVDVVIEAAGSGQLTADGQKDLFGFLISELRKNLELSPRDARNHMYLLAVLNRSQGYFPETADEVIALALQAEKISPTRPQIYFELGQGYFFKKEYDKGIAAFEHAIELNPEPKESHINLLLAAIISGRGDIKVREETTLSGEKYVLGTNDYIAIARAYVIAKNNNAAIAIYKQISEADPKNQGHHARLAALYGELCDIENARREVEIASELNQAFILQGQDFLRQLEENCGK